MTCPICTERPLPPSHVRNHIYACSRCWYYKHKGRVRRYRATAKGRALSNAAQRRWWHTHQIGARRLRLSGRHVGIAESVEQAQQIRRHIRRRRADFTAQQREAYESQS